MRKSWQWRKAWLRYGIVFLFVCMCIGAGAILYFDGGRNQNASGLEETEIRKIEEELPEMDSDSDRYASDIKKVARISIRNNAITVVQSSELFFKFYENCGRILRAGMLAGSGDVIYYYTYEYNDEGLLWKQTFAAPGWESREEYWMEYEYDDMGNQTQEIQCSVNGNIISRGEWKYDASGQKTEERCFDDDGVSARTEYAYDSWGNLTQEICYDQGGSIFEKYEYEYDEDGRKIKETDARGIDDAGTFEYDYHEWEYDYAGIERKERWSCSYMESWTEWKYDAMGNWTAMIEYHGAGSVESCTEQKHQYVYLGS